MEMVGKFPIKKLSRIINYIGKRNKIKKVIQIVKQNKVLNKLRTYRKFKCIFYADLYISA